MYTVQEIQHPYATLNCTQIDGNPLKEKESSLQKYYSSEFIEVPRNRTFDRPTGQISPNTF